jgi:hypothetical protein
VKEEEEEEEKEEEEVVTKAEGRAPKERAIPPFSSSLKTPPSLTEKEEED